MRVQKENYCVCSANDLKELVRDVNDLLETEEWELVGNFQAIVECNSHTKFFQALKRTE